MKTLRFALFISVFLAGTAGGQAPGVVGDVIIPQRNTEGSFIPKVVNGPANAGKALGFDVTGAITAVAAGELGNMNVLTFNQLTSTPITVPPDLVCLYAKTDGFLYSKFGTTEAGPFGASTGTPGSGDVTQTGVQTLTNKRIVPRVQLVADGAGTVTAVGDLNDKVEIAEMSGAGNFAPPTGTPNNGQELTFIVRTTTARAVTWDAAGYDDSDDLPLPTLTSGGTKIDMFKFMYSTVAGKNRWLFVGEIRGF